MLRINRFKQMFLLFYTIFTTAEVMSYLLEISFEKLYSQRFPELRVVIVSKDVKSSTRRCVVLPDQNS